MLTNLWPEGHSYQLSGMGQELRTETGSCFLVEGTNRSRVWYRFIAGYTRRGAQGSTRKYKVYSRRHINWLITHFTYKFTIFGTLELHLPVHQQLCSFGNWMQIVFPQKYLSFRIFYGCMIV